VEKLTVLLTFFAALGVATERIVEIIKNAIPWLTNDKLGWPEELRKGFIHVIAIGVGAILASQTFDELSADYSMEGNWWMYLVFGALAAGGSGIWNSLLDIVREVNKQKQEATKRLKAAP
jgi:hypothetical protein